MTRVAVTGVGGVTGRRLLDALDGQDDVEQVVGFDVRAPEGVTSPKLDFHQGGPGEAPMGEWLDGVDVVVHLAMDHAPGRGEDARGIQSVDGARAVARAAVEAGVPKLVYVSTGMVYGAHPDNDVPLTEDAPLRANAASGAAERHLEVEQWLWSWARSRPEVTLTVLRPAVVTGAGSEGFLDGVLEAPRFPLVKGHKPPLQFTHVDDLVSAVVHVVERDLPGAYNVTPEGWLSFDEVTAILDRSLLELPEQVAFSLVEGAWTLGWGYGPPGQVHYLMHPWVLSADKLLATGWRPRHSNRDALSALVADHADWLRVPGVRVRRSMLRGGAAGIGAVLALLLLVLRARRHRAAAV